MRVEYPVIPLVGIGPVKLGMPRTEVRAIFGTPEYVEAAHERFGLQFRAKDCFFKSCLQVRYNAKEEVEGIQFSRHPMFAVVFDSVPVHDAKVEMVAQAVSQRAELNRNDSEFPHTYAFPSIGLSLWRERLDKTRFDTINLVLPERKRSREEPNQ
jgi:hypothetical protein